jgi:hypothetical protein
MPVLAPIVPEVAQLVGWVERSETHCPNPAEPEPKKLEDDPTVRKPNNGAPFRGPPEKSCAVHLTQDRGGKGLSLEVAQPVGWVERSETHHPKPSATSTLTLERTNR